MLVLYGDSMLSGFPTTRDIPPSCRLPQTVVSDAPLVTIPSAMRSFGLDVANCSLPGHRSDDVLKWFNEVPQWWGCPTVFSFGFNDRPQNAATVLNALDRMSSRLTEGWWFVAMPVTSNQVADNRSARIIEANAEIARQIGKHFLDPMQSLWGSPLPPAHRRIDCIHPTSEANRLIARWLIANTIGAMGEALAA